MPNIPDSNIRNMLNAISEGNHILNEVAQFYKNIKTDCPDCSYDPIRGESTDYNCETCGGTGKIVTLNHTDVPVSIETEEDFAYEFTNAGKITSSQILVTVDRREIDSTLNTNSKYDLNNYSDIKSMIEYYDYFGWQGATYSLVGIRPGYLQGYLYEVAFVADLRE